MAFKDDTRALRSMLGRAGFAPTGDPYDTSMLDKGYAISDIEVIARKDYYNVIYLETESNWRGISSDVARKNPHPCLVITRYGDTHTILSTTRDHYTKDKKARYVVVDNGAKKYSVAKFIRSIKTGPEDDTGNVDAKVQSTLDKFAAYQEALDNFADDLDDIIQATKTAVDGAVAGNKEYATCEQKFLGMCRDVISTDMDEKDVRDMLVQHILTYRIFALVYGEHDFHHANVVARELESLKEVLGMSERRINYDTMELIAESITDMEQRQEFLKKFYEVFYEKYDPAKADRDGIVYTPSEVVNFMVTSTDQLLQKHFSKSLSNDEVTVLDPATGTGTFIVHVLNQLNLDKVEKKYTNGLHANEISILPYYIAALNIENAYKEKTGRYREFENICWMDTLDSGVKDYGKVPSYFENDNVKRISRQQEAEIHVVIGNPPYNAVQTSYNNANAATKYPYIDQKIQQSYTQYSVASQQIKSQDMYKRFLKWSSDRIGKKGIVVFVSNNAFLDAKADNGVRRALYNEFNYIYIVNLRGNARLAGEAWRREGGKVFGQQARVGIAVYFLIKAGENTSNIKYIQTEDYMNREAKMKWLKESNISALTMEEITPDPDAVWLNQTNNDFDNLIPVLPRKHNESIFAMVAIGVNTAKDQWAYDFDINNLKKKVKFYISVYGCEVARYKIENPSNHDLISWVDKKIKWSRETIKSLTRMHNILYAEDNIKAALYRPFIIKHLYYTKRIIDVPGRFSIVFKNSKKNKLIGFSNPKTNVPFNHIGTDLVVSLDCVNGTQAIPLWRYNNGKRLSNVTDYGLQLFRAHYHSDTITGDDVFYYTYAIFNDPKYEKKYRFNLQRDFPRIPLAQNFKKWSRIGKDLFKLHCNFATVEKYSLTRIDKRPKKNRIQLKLRTEEVDKKMRIAIIIDDATTLNDVPKEVLEYKIGSKNPLEWILEFYKESKNQIKENSSNDEDVRNKFNTYRLADYKEDLITLLQRVTTVCIETVRLRKELEQMRWGPQPKLTFTIKSNNTAPETQKRMKLLARPVPIQATLDGARQERLLRSYSESWG